MKNILRIFGQDVRRVWRNVIALIVVMGVTIVPCLYAWFNIAASWDPYGSTGELKVAVASVDDGYNGELIPISVNLGDNVLTALRENSQLDWVFTSEEKALNGVKSGKYYAAIIIPEDFSTDMMSIFSEEIQTPEITYYYNAKENAIAPKVTDKGASAIQTQVNETFIETVTDTALTALETVSNMADESGVEGIMANLITNLEQISSDLALVSGTLQSFSDLTASAQSMLNTTSAFLEEANGRTSDTLGTLEETSSSLDGIQTTLSGATGSIGAALDSGLAFYDEISGSLDTVFAENADDTEALADTLEELPGRVGAVSETYASLKTAVEEIGTQHPELADQTGRLSARLDEAIVSQTALSERLSDAAEVLRSSSSDAAEAKAELDSLLAESASDLTGVQSDYETEVKPKLDQLFDSMSDTDTQVSALLTQLDATADGIGELSGTASSKLTQMTETLDSSVSLLDDASERLNTTLDGLKTIQESGDYEQLSALLSGDRESITAFLASPVTLEETKIYPVENYGSSMAPFYSTLAIWVGGVVLVGMLKVSVSETSLEGMGRVRDYQIYIGRYLIFLIIGLMQSTLIGLGDLLYLGIQCEKPFLFMLACWVSSLVYVNIMYTMTVSFGDVGKAVCVVLMVIQVAGSGGTFPIEVAPAAFQAVYPLLPFTHSMTAMRETIGGMYGMIYWTSLGRLLIFLGASLILGLVLRKPVIRLNEWIIEKLESTHLI